MNKIIKKIVIPLTLAANIYACDDGDDPVDFATDSGSGGGIVDAGSDATDSGSDCVKNNPGGDIENGTKQHYTVTGDTCQEASNDIFDAENGKGFWDEESEQRYAGDAGCNINYTWSYTVTCEKGMEQCSCTASVTEKNVTYESTVRIPRWDGCDPCWDQFLKGLVKHEQGHVNDCKDISDEFEADLARATDTKCHFDCQVATTNALNALRGKINTLFANCETEWNNRSKAYDDRTNHGVTQGATLDCNCNE